MADDQKKKRSWKVESPVRDPEAVNITFSIENSAMLDDKFARQATITSNPTDYSNVQRTFRVLDPAHCIFPIDSFSRLQKEEIEPYESAIFEASGFRWRLAFYPKGYGEGKEANHISLYLRIVETKNYPEHWTIHAFFRFFIHNQINDTHLMIQEPLRKEIKRFHEIKKEYGIAELLSFEEFLDPLKGYLVEDKCYLGAEVFVVNPLEGFKLSEPISHYSWMIENFSKLQSIGGRVYSKPFSLGGTQWKLLVFPNGCPSVINQSLSVFLVLHEPWNVTKSKQWQTRYTLSLLNMVTPKQHSKTVEHSFGYKDFEWGFPSFISLENITAEGFKDDDKVFLEVKFNSMIIEETVLENVI